MSGTRRDVAVVVAALVALVLSLASLARLEPTETPTRELVVPKSFLVPLERVRSLFGPTAESELVFVSAIHDLPPERIDAIEAAVRQVPGVTRAWSSRSRPRLVLSDAQPPEFSISTAPRDGEPETKSAIDRLLRPRPKEAGIWLVMDEGTRRLGGARRFEADLRAALDRVRTDGETVRVVGAAARRVASWEIAASDGKRALPWLLGAVALVPLLFFRSALAVFFPLVIAGLTTGTLFAAYRTVYGRLDPWALLLLPIVWSVATMDALHLYEGTSDRRDAAPAAVAHARAEVSLPALVTAITTALSLLTLAFPGAPPLLGKLGIWGAAGTMLAFGFTFAVGGSLLRLFHARVRAVPSASRRLVRAVTVVARRRARLVALVWVALLVVAAAGASRIHVEASYRHTFAPGTEPAADALAVERALGADLVPLEIYLEARTPRQRHPNELLLATLALADYLATLPETRVSLSASTLLSEWTAADPRAISFVRDPTFLERIHERASALVADPLVTEWLRLDRGVSRTQVIFAPMTYARREQILGWIEQFAASSTLGYRVTFGGPSWLEQVMEREGLRGIAWGAVTDLVLLAILMAGLLRRGRLVAVAFVGNVAPVLLLLGVMGLTGLPWSFNLLGMPMLVLGLAIDDTIHLLWPLRRAREGELAAALHRSIRAYGVAVAATATLLAASLAGLSLSGFGVNRELGVLLPAGLVIALAAELTLVPAATTLLSGSRTSRRSAARGVR